GLLEFIGLTEVSLLAAVRCSALRQRPIRKTSIAGETLAIICGSGFSASRTQQVTPQQVEIDLADRLQRRFQLPVIGQQFFHQFSLLCLDAELSCFAALITDSDHPHHVSPAAATDAAA